MSAHVIDSAGGAEDPELLAAFDWHLFQKLVANSAGAVGVQQGALVLVERDRVWFRSRFGVPEEDVPRDGRLWDEALSTEGTLVVRDLLDDPRFAHHPLVIGGVPVRFFASCMFRSQDGRPQGLMCLMHPEPLDFDGSYREALAGLQVFIENQLATIREFDRAAEVQRALLPREVPPLDGYDVAGACVPAKSAGGDFYHWYPIDGGMAFTLADVMGKGVGASIIAATVRAAARTARTEENVVVAIERAARALEQDLRGGTSFVTLFHARLRAADGRVSFVDAGHGLTVVVSADGTVRRLSTKDLPIGTTFADGWHEHRVILEKGGTLVTFSDGVLELYDGTLAVVDRVAEIVRRIESAQQIVDEITRLARSEPPPDDVTVVAIRRTDT